MESCHLKQQAQARWTGDGTILVIFPCESRSLWPPFISLQNLWVWKFPKHPHYLPSPFQRPEPHPYPEEVRLCAQIFIRWPKRHSETSLDKEGILNPSWANQILPNEFYCWNPLKISLWAGGNSPTESKFGIMKSQRWNDGGAEGGSEWAGGQKVELETQAERRWHQPFKSLSWCLPGSSEFFLSFLPQRSRSSSGFKINAIY